MQVAKVGLWHIVLTWLELEEKKTECDSRDE